MGVLTGLRIIDATYGSAGPLATQLLADMGASITRIDAPGIDPRRDPGAFVRLRGRQSIVIDLANPAARPLLERLVAQADVLLTEPGLDAKHPIRFTYAELAALNQRLVYCRIAAYGDEGPLAGAPAHDHLVAARYGVYDQVGWRDGPTYLMPPVPSLGAAYLAVQAIGAALYVRERTGQGQEVTTSLLAGTFGFRPGMVLADNPPGGLRRPPYKPFGALPFYSIYECADGSYLHFGCLSVRFQKNAVAALGLEVELADFPFGEQLTPERRDDFVAIIAPRMKEKSYADWAAVFEAADVPHGEARWTEDLLDDPQVRHEGLVVTIDDPVHGPVEQIGEAVRFSREPYVAPAPAPLPGQHTREVCAGLGLADAEVEALLRAGAIA